MWRWEATFSPQIMMLAWKGEDDWDKTAPVAILPKIVKGLTKLKPQVPSPQAAQIVPLDH